MSFIFALLSTRSIWYRIIYGIIIYIICLNSHFKSLMKQSINSILIMWHIYILHLKLCYNYTWRSILDELYLLVWIRLCVSTYIDHFPLIMWLITMCYSIYFLLISLRVGCYEACVWICREGPIGIQLSVVSECRGVHTYVFISRHRLPLFQV